MKFFRDPQHKFQSTLPRGERRYVRVSTGKQDISIHAPARGATRIRTGDERGFYISIHAPARGATISVLQSSIGKIFQSTLPRGERRVVSSNGVCIGTDFNPRSREGSDKVLCFANLFSKISIHAPARGATQ